MIEQIDISHNIQKHIMSVLMYKEFARFRDLRPVHTDTNLFSYHLKALLRTGFVQKTVEGYGLSQHGLAYVDRVSTEKMAIRTQPKIITMLVIQNSDGDVLLQRRTKQPYINAWTLPYGKLHIEDETIMAAARREAKEKLSLLDQQVRHVGEAYIRVRIDKELVSTTLAHIFRFERDDIEMNDSLIWVQPHKLSKFKLAPAVEEIVTRSFFNDTFFFEEFDNNWRQ
jgi:ADP-ribose pyrophosphatase YjhB (NUDIX family)